MSKRFIGIISICGFFLVLFGITIWKFTSEKNKQTTVVSNSDFGSSEKHANSLFDDPEFADAPNPEELELAQAEVLWPFALEKKPNRKEEVKEEWRDFAAKYPNNFYIPREIRAPMTEKQEKEQLEMLDSFTAMDATFSANQSKEKWSDKPSAEEPSTAERPSPNTQKAYFDFKINELESRIQMVEYWLENKKPDSDVKGSAEKDLQIWKKELATLREVRSQVPNT
ncbi:Hypothetical protein LBF_1201 [Leptospira biflexa serovar Patoc strain 'Patoc 1 (Ames)']|uniref:Uncharacterized protein n=1 Tax=Leptospira biflexa serovar Patoc (strain Patoc 1 / ATCC 23582 / Paris) TaxID=456481 RepID=B0SNT4_LEPBP|nr:hypothetical protein [Leptospira biflexa]ABZ93725.1 Hypothetical protein LBF_1201 [Leptospira biflexa serovar Patoc strain 'Patoc 1 (Ames)']ABZ97365.1 Conserved hypothetical protein [Leptospira biflexa serovar Patoc strain 'Patoc 1 (Paris)']